jgi:hypothetical protein
MPTYIFSTEYPDWQPSQPVAEWPHLLCVSFYATMEKIAREGSPEQRRHMRFFSLQLHKEAGGDPSLVDDIRRTRKEWRPKRTKPRAERRE